MLLYILQGIYVALVVLVLFNLTIFFHELGHFLVARWRKAVVERFAIWFGPAIWKKVVNKVEYRLGCIPLGGYVLLPQLATEAIEGKSETPAEQLKPLSPGVKIPILFAGSLANFIFGVAIACLLWVVGVPRDVSALDMTIGYVEPGSPEEKAGIRAGDELKAVNGKPIRDWNELLPRVALSLNDRVRLQLKRKDETLSVEVTPTRDEEHNIRKLNIEPTHVPVVKWVEPGWVADRAGVQPGDEFQTIDGEKISGSAHATRLIVARANRPTKVVVMRDGKPRELVLTPTAKSGATNATVGIAFGIKREIRYVVVWPTPWETIVRDVSIMVDTFQALLHPRKTGVGLDDLAGPPLIIGVLVDRTLVDIRLTLEFLVLLNINLAILNLLPIPVLDGGHILFSVIEAIRRRPLNQKFMEITQTVFAALIIALMLYVTFNDIPRLAKVFGGRRDNPPASKTAPATPPQK